MSEQPRELITLVDGREVWQYQDGTQYDPAIKRLVRGPDAASFAGDQVQASALAARRWELYRNAAADAVQRATIATTPFAGWGVIVERQVKLAQETEKGRASTEAARFVGSALGLMGEGRRQEEQQQPEQARDLPPGVALRALLSDLRILKGEIGTE
jgi:hypothetical protein